MNEGMKEFSVNTSSMEKIAISWLYDIDTDKTKTSSFLHHFIYPFQAHEEAAGAYPSCLWVKAVASLSGTLCEHIGARYIARGYLGSTLVSMHLPILPEHLPETCFVSTRD